MIIKLIGGLGNQMFQYAFAYALSQKNCVKLRLDTNAFDYCDLRNFELDCFNISNEIASFEEINQLKYETESLLLKQLRKLRRRPPALSKNYYQEPHFHFDQYAQLAGSEGYFQGYWQSEKYFIDFRKELLQQFTLTKPLDAKSKEYEALIENSESVSLHIRRGDYISNTHTNNVHGSCSLDYYKGAIAYLQKKIICPRFFVFSDDLAWAKENLTFIEDTYFIELDADTPDAEEMYLMSQCQHNIIANSSFSWWGAWLNSNPTKTVIAPKQWFRDSSINTTDLIPSEWIQL